MAQELGQLLKRARRQEGLTQDELGQKIGVGQASIAQWESGYQTIPKHRLKDLKNVLGDFAQESDIEPEEIPAFGAWLRRTRTQKGMSVPELAERSGVSAPAIYFIETGKSLNPQPARFDDAASHWGFERMLHDARSET